MTSVRYTSLLLIKDFRNSEDHWIVYQFKRIYEYTEVMFKTIENLVQLIYSEIREKIDRVVLSLHNSRGWYQHLNG